MKITIQDVRCFEQCELVLPAGSRTVLVGTNNAGKSTLLDIVIRSLWSLPGYGNFQNDWPNRLGLSSSYYRRQGTAISRPRINVAIPIPGYFPNETAFTPKHHKLNFQLAATESERRIEPNNPANVYLWPYSWEISIGADSKTLFKFSQPISELADLQVYQGAIAELSLRSEEDWISFRENPSFQNWGGQQMVNVANVPNPFTKALKSFIERVFYISAGRNPQFVAHTNDWDLRQDRIQDITPLLNPCFWHGVWVAKCASDTSCNVGGSAECSDCY